MAFGIDDAIAAGLKIVDKFIPDPAAKMKAELELRKDLAGWDKAQMEVNKAEGGVLLSDGPVPVRSGSNICLCRLSYGAATLQGIHFQSLRRLMLCFGN